MKKQRRIIAGILILVLMLINLGQVKVMAYHDINAPKLDISSLSISNSNPTIGGQVTVSFKASDDLSGIQYATVWYIKPITGNLLDVSMKYNSSTGKYEGKINIDSSTESGQWKIKFIYISDANNNETKIFNEVVSPGEANKSNLNMGNFNVKNTIVDTIPPVLDSGSLKVSSSSPVVGQTIQVSLKASDNQSGISYVTVWYVKPGTKKLFDVALSYNSSTGRYEGSIPVNSSTEAGEWKIKYIYLMDKSYNGVSIFNKDIMPQEANAVNLTAGNFSVASKTQDTTPPLLDIASLRVNSSEITQGNQIKISLKAQDSESGIKYATVWYQVPGRDSLEAVSMSYNSTSKEYEGKIATDSNTLTGLWRIAYVYLVDNDGNENKVYNIHFNIKGSDLTAGNYALLPPGATGVPSISGAKDILLLQGDAFNAISGLKASDVKDGDITSKLIVTGKVDTSVPGIYSINYSVTDSDGYTSALTVKATVQKTDWFGHWGRDAIRKGMERGWINSSASFRPEDPVTRAEFIKIVNRAFHYTEKTDIVFTDVKKEYWYYEEVRIAAKAGYISTANKAFYPNAPITREEVAAILTTIMNNKDSKIDKLLAYSDRNKISSWAITSVEGAIEAGYMGAGSQQFRPQDKVVRAEAVTAVSRIK